MIRILDEKKDIDLLRIAWKWEAAAPQWFRSASQAVKETFEDFIVKAKGELLIGVFEDEIKAVLRISEGNQLHLYVKKGSISAEKLLIAFESIKVYLVNHGITKFSGWIPKRNRHVIAIYKALGFTHDGVRCWQGSYERNGERKPCEWLLYKADFSCPTARNAVF